MQALLDSFLNLESVRAYYSTFILQLFVKKLVELVQFYGRFSKIPKQFFVMPAR